MTVIKVENLGKKYLIKHQQRERYVALRDVITNKFKSFGRKVLQPVSHELRAKSSSKEDFWALRDISFEINQGDRVGIIGRNGAGKTTLLKLLSRITEPTTGRITLKGRVASLLEVGTGFHPELTGRENIYLNGAILGMSKVEIKKKFDEIVDFAEIEKFLDTPVKRYSSGMYVRLAFAVAAHLEPEMLLVDEVLAVGDAQFQKKCLGKMGEVAKEGRTVLFVSHNMEAIQNLCSESILLDNGRMLLKGSSQQVIHDYISQSLSSQVRVEWDDLNEAPGNDKAKLIKAEVRNMADNSGIFFWDKPFDFEFVFYNKLEGYNNLDITFHLVDEREILVFVGSTAFLKEESYREGYIRAICHIPSHLLNAGTYTISRLLLVKNRGHVIYEYKNALTFEVLSSGSGELGWMGKKEGIVKPLLSWDTEQMN
jgi:lipopolysaccharide transport system ATP-binding protein